MAGRYLVTGVQLSIIKGVLEHKDVEPVRNLMDEIVDKQFVGNSKNSILDDVAEFEKQKEQIIIDILNKEIGVFSSNIKEIKLSEEAKKGLKTHLKSMIDLIR